MKQFDLEAAKRGAAVCTRNGKQARIVCLDADNPLFLIVALVRDTLSGKETPQSYRDDGGWLPANTECNEDLMMRDDDYLEKLERGEYGNHIVDVNDMVVPTCEESLQVGLTKREWFAGMAMQGIFAGRNWPHEGMIPDCIGYARNAVELADALIEELEKR
mgnify:CR=1 FL=1|jgi:hypothetical protein